MDSQNPLTEDEQQINKNNLSNHLYRNDIANQQLNTSDLMQNSMEGKNVHYNYFDPRVNPTYFWSQYLNSLAHNYYIPASSWEQTHSYSTNVDDSVKEKSRAPKSHWIDEEDDRLREIVLRNQKNNCKQNWKDIAEELGGRSAKQCRERWSEYLDPSINLGSFTPSEDELILKEQIRLGNKWRLIANMTQNRTPTAVKVRWHFLQRNGKHLLFKNSYKQPATTNRIPPPPTDQTPPVGTSITAKISINKAGLPEGAAGTAIAKLPGFPEDQSYYIFPFKADLNRSSADKPQQLSSSKHDRTNTKNQPTSRNKKAKSNK